MCALIMLTELHPEAGPTAMQALAAAAAPDAITPPAFLPVLEAAAVVVERHSKARSARALLWRHCTHTCIGSFRAISQALLL